jgi:hypothetical protein
MRRQRERGAQAEVSVGDGAASRGEEDPVEMLIARARRLRRRGDRRGALLALRQACLLDEWRARTYTLFGARASEAGRYDDAVKALRHARWLRQRAGETSRAAVTAQLLERARRPD